MSQHRNAHGPRTKPNCLITPLITLGAFGGNYVYWKDHSPSQQPKQMARRCSQSIKKPSEAPKPTPRTLSLVFVIMMVVAWCLPQAAPPDHLMSTRL